MITLGIKFTSRLKKSFRLPRISHISKKDNISQFYTPFRPSKWLKMLARRDLKFCVLKIPIPGIKNNPGPQDLGLFGIFHSDFFQNFLGIFSGFLNPDPDHRDFKIFRNLLSEFFRGFHTPIPSQL